MSLRLILLLFLICKINVLADQSYDDNLSKTTKDSVFISEIQDQQEPDKVLHAEPLFIDLIRDLGARKGEKEWNIGLGITDNMKYDYYTYLVEYEFAPIDRLGLEIELPFSYYYPSGDTIKAPGSKLNSLKLAGQYTFFVSQKYSTSLAIGYINEFEFVEFSKIAKQSLISGNVYNPFFVGAKRWGNNFHTLIYTGPQIVHHFSNNSFHTNWQINTNFHYMIPGTRNFVGIEFNKDFLNNDFDMTIRPQMRVSIADNLLIGIVSGIPINRENQRFSSFLRIIYEPGH